MNIYFLPSVKSYFFPKTEFRCGLHLRTLEKMQETSFPKIAIIKYYKLGNLKQEKFIFSHFWKTRCLKSQCLRSHAPSGGSRGESFLVLFLASGGFQQSLAFLNLQVHHSSLCRLLYVTCVHVCVSSCKAPVIGFRVCPKSV